MRGVDRFAVDANVILRYLLQDDKELSDKANAIMEGMQSGRFRLYCEPVTLAEVVWVLTSFYKLPREMVSTGLEPILRAEGFVMPDKDRYVNALKLYSGPIGHFGDACACAAAMEQCGGRLFSFDRKLSGIEGVTRSEG